MSYWGIYPGVVEEDRDPDKLGRVKVRVPAVYGTPQQISVDSLPWALPRGLPSGGTPNSGGYDHLPLIGDQVWVQFLNGEPEKPVWEWAMQNRTQKESFPLHSYGPNGKPNRAAITRYGNTIEINETSITLLTKNGNVFVLDDGVDGALTNLQGDWQLSAQDFVAMVRQFNVNASDGINLETTGGAVLISVDLAIQTLEDMIVTAGTTTMFTGGCFWSARDGRTVFQDAVGSILTLDGVGNAALALADGTFISLEAGSIQLVKGSSNIVIKDGQITVTAQEVAINSGSIGLGPTPVSSVALTKELVALFNQHTHSNGNNGSPTGPPLVPLQEVMIGSKTTTAT